MDKTNKNHSIRCTVTSCENHNMSENYCALDTVNIGTHAETVNPETWTTS